VIGFGSSARLAAAYGLAVTGTFVTTTILFLAVARATWRWSTRRTTAVGGLLLLVDLTLLAASLTKVPDGGWLPLLIAAAAFVVLTTWRRGRLVVVRNRAQDAGPLAGYVGHLHNLEPPLQRLPGTAVFLEGDRTSTPLALRAHVEHGHALHRSVILLSVATVPRAHVDTSERIQIDDLGHREDGIVQVIARFGYMDRPDVPGALRLAAARDLTLDVSNPSYYVSKTALTITDAPGIRRWRKRLYLGLAKLAADPVAYFGLPDDRVVIMGSRVRL
jgi:KUP system potassium uptake protein